MMHRHKVPGKMIIMIILLMSLCPSKAQDATQTQDAPFAKIMTGSSGSVENVTFEDFSDQTKDDTGNLKREISSTGISEDILCYNYDVTKCKATKKGKEYRGKIANTKSGKTCQAWASQVPHEHDRTSHKYPDSGLESNYCRNPDGEPLPWCYTTEIKPRWEYCDIPECPKSQIDEKCCTETVDKGSRAFTEIPIKTQSDFPSFTKREATIYDVTKCKKDNEGKEYRGKIAKTKSGKTCQAWESQKPHKHDVPPADYPDAGLDSNYCRNPKYQDVPWCYTDDSKTRFELCHIPNCPLYQTDLKIVGQRVYSSQVYKILEDSNYPPSEQIDETKEYNMIIKADSFYCDKDINIEGLTKFTLVARSIVSNNCKINLKHESMTMKPDMSATFLPNHGRTSTTLERKNGRDGADGINGKDGTKVVIGLITGSGKLNIETKGADGLKGGDGGNGQKGNKGEEGSCTIGCKKIGTTGCENTIKITRKPGKGGSGGDAGAAGKPGNGGAAGEIKVIVNNTRLIAMKLQITGCKGNKGPEDSSPGKPGNGGDGGYAGDMKGCKTDSRITNRPVKKIVDCIPDEGIVTRCRSNGESGTIGKERQASSQVADGSNMKITLSSAKEDIQSMFDETILELSLQQADEVYMQGKDNETKEICTSFLMKSDKKSFTEYCNRIMMQMSSGLNYFGYKENEFPSLDLETEKRNVDRLLERADKRGQHINEILSVIERNDIMKINIKLTSENMIRSAELEKEEVFNLVKLEQTLKTKAIENLRDMESEMFKLAKKIETDLYQANEDKKKKYAADEAKLALVLVGGFVSFSGGDPFGKIEAAIAVVNNLMDISQPTKDQKCHSQYEEMKKFADIMMQVKPYKAADPFQTRLSDIPSVATVELLKVQTLEKRDDLLLGFKCLIENSGFTGDVLEGTIGTFFDYSFGRLNTLGLAIEHDIKLKQYQFARNRLTKTIAEMREAIKGNNIAVYNPTVERARLLFKERMIDSFRITERQVLRALYLKSIAFQFETLWEPKLLSKVAAMRRPHTTAMSGAIFTGNIYLRDVNDYLESLERKWQKCGSDHSTIGKSTYLWIFTPQTHKKLFEDIKANGMGSVVITKDGICSTPKECVNLRLEKVFIEVYGKGLFSNQRLVHVHLTHSGQNLIYMPPDGSKTKYYVQTTKKTVHIGVANKDLSRTGCRNGGWRCTSKFPKGRKARMCSLTAASPFEKLAGTTPCRSLFSQYTISLPKNELDRESATLNNKNLDWTKIKKIKFYAGVRTYKNYPSESDCAGFGGRESKKDNMPKEK